MNPQNPSSAPVSRRDFLKSASVLTATTVAAGFPGVVHAQAKKLINAVVIGLGGRGSGAGGDFLSAAKTVGVEAKIVAVADIFPNAARSGTDKFGVPAERCFSGFDAYQKALAVPDVNYAILATPPGFRPPFFRAAIEAGKHVFMEKPVAVDGPGLRIMLATGEQAKAKGLKVAAGTQRRHRPSYQQAVKRIQDGAIGDVVALRAYWVNTGPIWHRGEQGSTDLERQIANWYHYIWLCGDHICEQHVHDLDVCNWIMNDHPVRCWGQGSRQQLGNKSGEIWDNFDVEYEYANGVRLFSYCGQVTRSWGSVSEHVMGGKGAADLHDGRNTLRPKDGTPSRQRPRHSHPPPRRNTLRPKDGTPWRPQGVQNDNGYVNEHVDLINAILNDTELNEAKNVTTSTLTAIMGREAAYSGGLVEAEQLLKCEFAYGPPALYENPAKMEWGAFRTLKPPMPSQHDIFKNPALVKTA